MLAANKIGAPSGAEVAADSSGRVDYHSMVAHQVGRGFHLGSDDFIDVIAILTIVGLAWSANNLPGFRIACEEAARFLIKPVVQVYSVRRLSSDAKIRPAAPELRTPESEDGGLKKRHGKQ